MYQQTIISMLLFFSMAGTFGLVSASAHSRWLAGLANSWEVRRFQENREHMMDRSLFLEFEDRLILDQIPHADYSRGGVFFFGSSTMKWAMTNWTLLPDLRPLIGNYAIGASSHALQYVFIRHLVEHENFLKAGGDKVHVVLGLYWSMGLYWNPQTYFKPLWERHGLYTYNDTGGIQPVPMNSFVRAYLTERARCAGFLGSSMNRAGRALVTAMGIPLSETEKIQDPARVRQLAVQFGNPPEWEQKMDTQMRVLQQLVDYLQQRKVGITIVLLPERAPYTTLPEPIAYENALRDLCQQDKLPFVDLSRLLSEDEFWDMNHSNYRGLLKTNAALVALAINRLQSMGLYEPKTNRAPVLDDNR